MKELDVVRLLKNVGTSDEGIINKGAVGVIVHILDPNTVFVEFRLQQAVVAIKIKDLELAV